MEEAQIRQIIETYELSPTLEDKIIRIAQRQIEERDITEFSDAYTYLTELVDKFTQPRTGRGAVKLDARPDQGFHPKTRTRHEWLIGQEDARLRELLEEHDPTKEEVITAESALSTLEATIDQETVRIMRTLFSAHLETLVPTSVDQVHVLHEAIDHKINAFLGKYYVDGKLTLPPRPIKNVSFEPELRLRFGKRNYNGNPLAFFREHHDAYEGLSRAELAQQDGGLYQTLLRTGQLDEAIPKLDGKGRTSRRFNGDPLTYFKTHEDHYAGLSRTELLRVDPSLYIALQKNGQLEKAIPVTYRFSGNPLAYFKENEEFYGTLSRRQLQTVDDSLYRALRNASQLDGAIPKDKRFSAIDGPHISGGYRGYENPLAYFRAHAEEFRGMTRTELGKADQGLYITLKAVGQLDDAIPLKDKEGFRGFPTALAYLEAHQKDYGELSRTDLRKKDKSLAKALQEEGQLDELFPRSPRARKKVFVKEGSSPRGYYNGYSSGLEAFLDNYDRLQGLTRYGLVKTSWGLYKRLLRDNHLDLAIPKDGSTPNLRAIRKEVERIKKEQEQTALTFRGYPSPLDYFNAHKDEFGGLTRTELHRRDSPLHAALKESNQLNTAVPLTHRGFPSPLDYLRAHPERYGHLAGRGELSRQDQALYNALRRSQQLDSVFPMLKKRTWRGFKGPGEYFEAHKEEYRGIGLNGLRRQDSQLARSLMSWGYLEACLEILDDTSNDSGLKTIVEQEYTWPVDESSEPTNYVQEYSVRKDISDDLTDDEHHLTLCSFFRYNGDPYLAAEQVPFTPELLRKRWKGAGYRIPKVEPRTIPKELETPMTVNYEG